MMSRRAAATRRERDSVERWGIRESLESGGARRLDDSGANVEDKVAAGKRKALRTEGTDFVR